MARLSVTEFIHVYKVRGERFDAKINNGLHYDMIFQYLCKLFNSNIVDTRMINSYTYEHTVEIPVDDQMLYEMMRNVDYNLLWTNMEFMDKFRERLIFYNLYYDIGQKRV